MSTRFKPFITFLLLFVAGGFLWAKTAFVNNTVANKPSFGTEEISSDSVMFYSKTAFLQMRVTLLKERMLKPSL